MKPTTEKSERNREIFCLKDGYRKFSDTKPSRKTQTYRQLSPKYNLSITYLQIIVNRWRKRHQLEIKKKNGKN